MPVNRLTWAKGRSQCGVKDFVVDFGSESQLVVMNMRAKGHWLPCSTRL